MPRPGEGIFEYLNRLVSPKKRRVLQYDVRTDFAGDINIRRNDVSIPESITRRLNEHERRLNELTGNHGRR